MPNTDMLDVQFRELEDRAGRRLGPDGVPNHVSAVRGHPRYWPAPVGHELQVFCDGHRLRYVLEANRVRGHVTTKKYLDTPDGPKVVSDTAEMFYQGKVTFRVVKAERPE